MKQNPFYRTVVLLFALAILPQAIGQTPATATATAAPDQIRLTWTGNPATTMTITWRTDSTVKSGLVQYREGAAPTSSPLEAQAHTSTFTTDLETSLIHSATLTGLVPNRRYSYRVGDGEHWSRVHAFSTADPDAGNFTFLVFGDSQAPLTGDSPYSVWRKTVHNAYKANPGAKFMVNVGDLVDLGQNGAHWNAWFAAAAGVIDEIPEMPVMGNHAFYGAREWKPTYWLAQFVLPQNGPGALKGRVYSYDYGPVHFVVLDSQQEEQKQIDILKPQQAWLDADLAASNARWKIVFLHRPPYHNHLKRNNDAIKAAFAPIIEKHHVDLVFTGHDHTLASTCPIRDGVCMGEPSQGTIYYVSGQSGGKTYKDVAKMPSNAFFHNPTDQPNYLVVGLAGDGMTVKSMKQDGTVMDILRINKSDRDGY